MSRTRRRTGVLAALTALALATGGLLVPGSASAAEPAVDRVAGADRYATAVAVSKDAFPNTQGGTVFIASGASFPDALAAAPAAKLTGSPVLLVPFDGVPPIVRDELARLKPRTIQIVGGPGSVSAAVERDLASYASGATLRLEGVDRYSTAADISARSFTRTGGTVYLASGEGFADALGASAEAARESAPILLVRQSGLPATTETELRRLRPTTVVIAGGEGSVSAAVANRVAIVVPDARIVRKGGADRYETSALLAESAITRKPRTVFVASGAGFPDALAAAPAAAVVGAPVLLTNPNGLAPSVSTLLRSVEPDRIVVVGGPGSVSDAVTARLSNLQAPGVADTNAEQSLAMVNQLRAAGGLPPVRLAPALNDVAQAWTTHMATQRDYRHNPNLASQVPAGWRGIAENIAWSTYRNPSGTDFTTLWRDSPGHYANIMGASYTHMGYAQVYDPVTGRTYATQVFGYYPNGL